MIDIDEIKKYGGFMTIILALLLIVVSGIGIGLIYYTMDQTDTAFRAFDCTIENNTLVSSCQELFELGVYPFLALKEVLIWGNVLAIFGLVLGMLLLGYQSGRSPATLGLVFLFNLLLTYGGIEVSNIYRTFLENETFRVIMIDFTIYNRIMLGFPWFVFIISIFSLLIGIVNYQRTKINAPTAELDY